MEFEAKLWVKNHVLKRIRYLSHVAFVESQSQPVNDDTIYKDKHKKDVENGQAKKYKKYELHVKRCTLAFQSLMTVKIMLWTLL